jgi:hypothetical protein
VNQEPHDIVVTFPRGHHEGFSTACTSAEALNYAGADLKIQGYRECTSRICLAGYVSEEMTSSQRRDEEQEEREQRAQEL